MSIPTENTFNSHINSDIDILDISCQVCRNNLEQCNRVIMEEIQLEAGASQARFQLTSIG